VDHDVEEAADAQADDRRQRERHGSRQLDHRRARGA